MSTDALSTVPEALRTLELKGRMMLVSVLRLHTAERAELDQALLARMAEAPELMRDMPIVVDLSELTAESLSGLMIALERIREHGFKLIGVQQSGVVTPALCQASGLPVLALSNKSTAAEAPSRSRPAEPAPAREAPAEAPAEAPVPALHSTTRVINQPVRSGQQVYARGGDLIIVGSVSAGAEVLADGHIHIHGHLRGRALAGVRGLVSARIYCRHLDAELISIAGHYRIADDITDRERGDNRLVSLHGDTLHIDII